MLPVYSRLPLQLTDWHDAFDVVSPAQDHGLPSATERLPLSNYPGQEKFRNEMDHGQSEGKWISLCLVLVYGVVW